MTAAASIDDDINLEKPDWLGAIDYIYKQYGEQGG